MITAKKKADGLKNSNTFPSYSSEIGVKQRLNR
jgi:hypothetical protein